MKKLAHWRDLEVVDFGVLESSEGETARMMVVFHQGRPVQTVSFGKDELVWLAPRSKEPNRA
jgi:hypothetical protein